MDSVTVEGGGLTIEDVLDAFADAEHALPRAELQWALDHWEIAGPRFVALIDACVVAADLSPKACRTLFIALHLCGEKRETAAYHGLCRLMRHPTRIEAIMDDAVAGPLLAILVNIFDGNPDPLKSVIETADADEYGRDTALTALAYLAHTDLAPQVDMRTYLRHLRETAQPRAGIFWYCWASTVAILGFADLAEMVKGAFLQGLILPWLMRWDDFQKDLNRTLAGRTRMSGFEHHGIVPLSNAITALSEWYSEIESWHLEESAPATAPSARVPSPPTATLPQRVRNPYPHVGRNEPCPCGSGRKYKKCCLP